MSESTIDRRALLKTAGVTAVGFAASTYAAGRRRKFVNVGVGSRSRMYLTAITKTFAFKNYHETIAFVNASAWVSHREDHHPDLEVGYNKCRVRYSTHSAGGLTERDFGCAGKLEALFQL